jgi:preprotein translocase subunit SecE
VAKQGIPPLLAKPTGKSSVPPLLARPAVKKANPFSTNLNVLAPTGKAWANQDSDWAGNKSSGAQSQNASPSMIENLRAKARAWARDVVTLVNTPVPDMYAGEKNRLINFARGIKTTLEKVLHVDLPELKNAGLGVIPIVVGVAVVSAAAASMVKWSLDYKTLIAKVNNYNKMVADGIPPTNAAKLTQDVSATATSESPLGKTLKYLPLIGAAIVAAIVVPKLMRRTNAND